MINKLRVENFKCFTGHDIQFSPLTVFVGPNGSGKSTIIQSLLLLRQSIESLLLSPEADFTLPFDVSLNGPYLLQLGQASHVLSSNPTSNTIRLMLHSNEGVVGFDYSSEHKYAAHLLEGKLIEASFQNAREEMPLFGDFSYLNAERLGPRKALDMGGNTARNVGHQGEHVSYVLRELDVKRVDLPEFLRVEGVTSSFPSQVQAWFNTIIPNVRISYEVIEKMNMISLGYSHLMLDTDAVTPANTGFGISYVLPIIVAGLALSMNRNAILIVENPEAHLHPYSQSKIGRFLARLSMAGVQVIVETHSEHVVNGCRLEMLKHRKTDQIKINFVSLAELGDKQVMEISLNEFGELSKWPQGFFDQEEQDMKEMILLRKEVRKS